MGGFSDNYECGYWGDDALPIRRNQKSKSQEPDDVKVHKLYRERNDKKYRYLDVILTPVRLLDDDEQEERVNLTQLYSIETALKLIVTKEKTLDMYHEELYIGSVEKIFVDDTIDNTQIVNDFCFDKDTLKDVQAFWNGDIFYLRRDL